MPGSMRTEPEGAPRLATSREPSGPKRKGDKGTIGDQAVMDAVVIIGVAWFVLVLLVITLRRHNI